MIDSLSASAVTTLASSSVPAAAPAQPDALVAARFQAMMQAPTGAALAAAPTASGAPAPADDTLGGRILAGLGEVSTELRGAWSSLATRLETVSGQPSQADLLRLQADLLQVTLQHELVGKAVARSTQNIDTLVRMQ